MSQVAQGTNLGTKLRMSIEQMRLETGFPGPFTDVPYDLVAHLATPCWVKTLWESCRKFDISVSDDFGT